MHFTSSHVSRPLRVRARGACTVLFVFLSLGAGLLPLLLAGCGGTKKQDAPPALQVVVVRPEAREIVEWDEYTGRLASPDSVEVRAQVSGYLQSIHFKDGQFVEKGDLLFVIDPRPFEAALSRAEAALQQAESQAALAGTNLERAQQLRKSGAVAEGDLDTAETNSKQAQAAIVAARAQVNSAKLDLAFTRIQAPIRGRISRNYVSIGNLVTGGNANTTLLTTIVSLDPIYCYFEVDERSFLKYQDLVGRGTSGAKDDPAAAGGSRESESESAAAGTSGDRGGTAKCPMQMELANETGFPHEGHLNFVDNRVDLASSTVELRGVFPNRELKLTPGLFARVRIPASKRHAAILLPDQAIGTDQSQQFVYVVGDDGKVAYRRVELGPMAEGLRIVRRGVTPGDRVIVSGMQSVRPDAVVNAQEKPPGDFAVGTNGKSNVAQTGAGSGTDSGPGTAGTAAKQAR